MTLTLTSIGCSQQQSRSINGGAQDEAIVHGYRAQKNAPWAHSVVGLATRDNGSFDTFCSGTIFDSTTIVTAAHCILDAGDEPVFIVLGENQDDHSTLFVEADSTVFHEKYEENSSNDLETFDIGIVRLKKPVPAPYHPAVVMTDRLQLQTGVRTLIAGYGSVNGKTQKGMGILRSTQVTIKNSLFSPSEVQTDESRSGTCQGDSGGPAFVKIDKEWEWWGITTRGSRNCVGEGIYTRVGAYLGWINSNRQKKAAAETLPHSTLQNE